MSRLRKGKRQNLIFPEGQLRGKSGYESKMRGFVTFDVAEARFSCAQNIVFRGKLWYNMTIFKKGNGRMAIYTVIA